VSYLVTTTETRARRRNPRGMGGHLAGEIVAGALRLIDAGGSAETVTLRAIAREVGISAPSIYAHFRDRDEIVLAIARKIFDEIRHRVAEATGAGGDPVKRLLAGCRAYVDFGLEHPERYRAIFTCELTPPDARSTPTSLEEFAGGEGFLGADAFLELVRSLEECSRAGLSDSSDPDADAVAIWIYLHGLVSLRSGLDRFPWPPVESMLDGNVAKLAGVRRPA
jgi:AcrR family transcriptional regulator